LLLSFTAFAAPIRVAVMNFTVEELSYRSSQAAADFTALLQAELSANLPPGIELVERTELARAEQELQLGGIGLADRRDGLRAGHWARADWGVVGTLRTNAVNPDLRTLFLELVDYRQGTTTVNREVVIKSLSPTYFAPDGQASFRTTTVLREWFKDEANKTTELESQLKVAVIPMPPGRQQLEVWRQPPSVNAAPIRVLDFSAAGLALLEADLLASGMVRDLPGQDSRLADHFVSLLPGERSVVVWTSRSNGIRLDMASEFANQKDWSEELARYLASMRRQRSPDQGELFSRSELANWELNAPAGLPLPIQTSPEKWNTMDQRVAKALFLDPRSRIARETWLRVRWSVERNSDYADMFNFHRHRFDGWADYLDRFGPDPAGGLPIMAMTLEFPLSPAECFVNSGLAGFKLSNVVSAKSRFGIPEDVGGEVMTAWRLHFLNGLFRRLPLIIDRREVVASWTELLNATLDEMGHVQTGSQLARSRLPIFEMLWTRLRDSQPDRLIQFRDRSATITNFLASVGRMELWPSYAADIGATTRVATGEAVPATSSKAIALPRVHMLDEGNRADFLSLRLLDFGPRQVQATLATVRFPEGNRVSAITAQAWAGGRMWLLAHEDTSATFQQELVDPVTDVDLTMPTRPESQLRLWSILREKMVAEAFTNTINLSGVTGMFAVGDELWLGRSNGMLVLDVRTGRFRDLSATLPMVSSFAEVKGRLFVLGHGLKRSDDRGQTWADDALPWPTGSAVARAALWGAKLGVSDDWLMVLGNSGQIRAAVGSNWLSFGAGTFAVRTTARENAPTISPGNGDEAWFLQNGGLNRLELPGGRPNPLTVWKPRPGASFWHRFPGSSEPGPVTNSLPDHDLLSLLGHLSRRSSPTNLPAVCRLTGPVTCVVSDGWRIWVGAENGAGPFVGMLDSRSSMWIGRIPVSIRPKELKIVDDEVWIVPWAPISDGVAMVRISRAAFDRVPESDWLPDGIAYEELVAMTPNHRKEAVAWAALLQGRPDIARHLLPPLADEQTQAEVLFLMALLNDQFGLNQPAQAAEFGRMLQDCYPESWFTRLFRLEEVRQRAWQRVQRGQATASPDEQVLVADYDANRNASLDYLELYLALGNEPGRLHWSGGIQSIGTALANMMARAERDGRPGLAAEEIRALRQINAQEPRRRTSPADPRSRPGNMRLLPSSPPN